MKACGGHVSAKSPVKGAGDWKHWGFKMAATAPQTTSARRKLSYVHIYIHCVYAPLYIYIFISICVYIYVYTDTHTYIYIYVDIHLYIWMFIRFCPTKPKPVKHGRQAPGSFEPEPLEAAEPSDAPKAPKAGRRATGTSVGRSVGRGQLQLPKPGGRVMG